jgi:hypothetical protein
MDYSTVVLTWYVLIVCKNHHFGCDEDPLWIKINDMFVYKEKATE